MTRSRSRTSRAPPASPAGSCTTTAAVAKRRPISRSLSGSAPSARRDSGSPWVAALGRVSLDTVSRWLDCRPTPTARSGLATMARGEDIADTRGQRRVADLVDSRRRTARGVPRRHRPGLAAAAPRARVLDRTQPRRNATLATRGSHPPRDTRTAGLHARTRPTHVRHPTARQTGAQAVPERENIEAARQAAATRALQPVAFELVEVDPVIGVADAEVKHSAGEREATRLAREPPSPWSRRLTSPSRSLGKVVLAALRRCPVGSSERPLNSALAHNSVRPLLTREPIASRARVGAGNADITRGSFASTAHKCRRKGSIGEEAKSISGGYRHASIPRHRRTGPSGDALQSDRRAGTDRGQRNPNGRPLQVDQLRQRHPYARSAKSIGYNHVSPLRCGSAKRIVRNRVRLDRCGADVTDECRFSGWYCFRRHRRPATKHASRRLLPVLDTRHHHQLALPVS